MNEQVGAEQTTVESRGQGAQSLEVNSTLKASHSCLALMKGYLSHLYATLVRCRLTTSLVHFTPLQFDSQDTPLRSITRVTFLERSLDIAIHTGTLDGDEAALALDTSS